MHPSAAVEYAIKHRLRCVIHIEQHEVLQGYLALRFVDAKAGLDMEVTMSPDDLERLSKQITEHLAIYHGAAPTIEAVS